MKTQPFTPDRTFNKDGILEITLNKNPGIQFQSDLERQIWGERILKDQQEALEGLIGFLKIKQKPQGER